MPKLNHELFSKRQGFIGGQNLKRVLAGAVALTVAAAVWANWGWLTTTEAERYQAAYDGGRLDEALQIALALAGENPQSARAQLGVAAVYVQKALSGQDREASIAAARAAAARAAELDPSDSDAPRTIGYTYEMAGDYETAASYYERAIELAPRSAAALAQLGVVYAATGKMELAERQFDLAVRADSYAAEPRLLLAQARLARGDENYLAIEAILEPALGSPSVQLAADARATLARIRLAEGKPQAAEELARQAVDVAPGSFSANIALAEALYEGVFSRDLPWEETLAEVRSLADRAAAADPSRAMAPFFAFRAASALGDKAAAATYAARAIGLLGGDRTLSEGQRAEIKAQIEFAQGVKIKVTR